MIKELTHILQPTSLPCNHQALQKWVDVISVYNQSATATAPFVLDFIPATNVVLHLHFATNEATKSPDPLFARIFGPHLSHVPMLLPGSHVLWTLVFKPYGWFQLTGMSPNTMVDKCFPAMDIFGKNAVTELYNALTTQNFSTEDTVNTLEQWLHTAVQKIRIKEKPAFQEVVDAMVEKKGLAKVEEFLTEKVKIRSLERYFNRAVGVAPKTFMECIRYQLIYEYMEKNSIPNFQDLCWEGYYTDLAHFQRDQMRFRKPGVMKGCGDGTIEP